MGDRLDGTDLGKLRAAWWKCSGAWEEEGRYAVCKGVLRVSSTVLQGFIGSFARSLCSSIAGFLMWLSRIEYGCGFAYGLA